MHAVDTLSLSDTNRAERTFPTPSNSATDLTQSVNAPSFLRGIQLFLIHKILLAHPTCKQIQGVICRKSGNLFTLSVSVSVLSRDTETYIARITCRHVFFFPCLFQKYLELVQIVFDICCLSEKEPILRIHAQIFIYS